MRIAIVPSPVAVTMAVGVFRWVREVRRVGAFLVSLTTDTTPSLAIRKTTRQGKEKRGSESGRKSGNVRQYSRRITYIRQVIAVLWEEVVYSNFICNLPREIYGCRCVHDATRCMFFVRQLFGNHLRTKQCASRSWDQL